MGFEEVETQYEGLPNNNMIIDGDTSIPPTQPNTVQHSMQPSQVMEGGMPPNMSTGIPSQELADCEVLPGPKYRCVHPDCRAKVKEWDLESGWR